MAETRPPAEPGPRLGAFATFVAALLAALGLNGLRGYLARRAERHAARRAAVQERERQHEHAAEIARKRELRHEPVSLRVGPLLASLAGSAVLVAALGAGLWLLLGALEQAAQRADRPLSPLTTGQPAPPAPRLQVSPRDDWQALRATAEARLGSYGRGAGGALHIPIERAIDLVAQRGLPARPQAASAAGLPAHELDSAGGQPGGVTPAALGSGSGRPLPTATAAAPPTATAQAGGAP